VNPFADSIRMLRARTYLGEPLEPVVELVDLPQPVGLLPLALCLWSCTLPILEVKKSSRTKTDKLDKLDNYS